MNIVSSHALVAGALLSLAAPAAAQDPQLVPFNNRWGSTGQHATTGLYYPNLPPPGYLDPVNGVAPGTRIWSFTPKTRMQAGHVAGQYLTITGMIQNINVGAATTMFPATGHYQFMTGIAPAASVMAPHGFEHAPTGADAVSFPHGTINITSGNNWRHSFTLATPIKIPDTELVLFVEFKGGEYREHPTNGQSIVFDWRGDGMLPGANFAGYTVGQSPRAVTLTSPNHHIPQIGMIVKEPMFTATGFHANRYYTPPMPSEDYRAVCAAFADWATGTAGVNATLFFHFDAGGAFANGSATVFANINRTPFPASIPTPFGNLLLFPGDPVLTLFADAGILLPIDPAGLYTGGPSVALIVPPLGPTAAGLTLKMQGVLVDQNLQLIQLTNASSVQIL